MAGAAKRLASEAGRPGVAALVVPGSAAPSAATSGGRRLRRLRGGGGWGPGAGALGPGPAQLSEGAEHGRRLGAGLAAGDARAVVDAELGDRRAGERRPG